MEQCIYRGRVGSGSLFKPPGTDVHPLKEARTQMTTICTTRCKARLSMLTHLVLPWTLAVALIYRGEYKGSLHLNDLPQPSQLLQGRGESQAPGRSQPSLHGPGLTDSSFQPFACAGPSDRYTSETVLFSRLFRPGPAT